MPARRPARDGVLQSRVARRVAVLFVGCAIVPLAGLAVVITQRTTEHLERQATERLQHDAKTVMMEALGRLDLLSTALRLVGLTLAADPASAGDVASRAEELLPAPVDVLTFVPEGARSEVLGRADDLPPLDAAARAQLQRGQPVIVPQTSADGSRRHFLHVPIRSGAHSSVVVASVSHAWLFGLDQPDPLPPDSELCVYDAERPLVCSEGIRPAVRAAAAMLGPDLQVVLDGGAEGPMMVRTRLVPLQLQYATEPWTIAILRPRAATRALLQAFLLDFWKVLALSLLVVSLLVVSQVRRQMHPLVALTAATRRLAARDFSTPVAVSSGDEFEELGASFNQLSAELGRQFAELEAFSQGTLEALARTIDAKSHWTAGHSERVTTMAVALALEMQLPEAEVTLLRRGGLVHDIGKLATPQEILDKAEMLTQEEEIIMRNHTLDGVHILEPIPAFRALLPIVEQHHERWDGRGYPHGLAGVNIARTARVLAVADVFDAMRSDRPYRTGMPRANVVTMIRAGAGTHFDPDVVVAFVRLMAADTGRSCEELAG